MTQRAFYSLLLSFPLLFALAAESQAASKDWRIGRVYNRMVCNDCHRQNGGEVISPIDRTIAEWKVYFKSDAHDVTGKANPSISYFTSSDYRQSIKDTNKAAAKFIDTPDEQMRHYVSTFFIRGAKDSDTPARCQ